MLLAACDGGQGAIEPPPGAVPIACAIADGAFDQRCFVEQSATPEGLVLTVRHPDGGFRRLLMARDGTGVTAADGAERAEVTLRPSQETEVAIGGARYRLAASVGTLKGA